MTGGNVPEAVSAEPPSRAIGGPAAPFICRVQSAFNVRHRARNIQTAHESPKTTELLHELRGSTSSMLNNTANCGVVLVEMKMQMSWQKVSNGVKTQAQSEQFLHGDVQRTLSLCPITVSNVDLPCEMEIEAPASAAAGIAVQVGRTRWRPNREAIVARVVAEVAPPLKVSQALSLEPDIGVGCSSSKGIVQ